MADIEFNFGDPIALDVMLPINPGVAVGLPAAINANAGVYIILNRYPNRMTPENRYMGITNNFQNRFASRQGACYELGLERQALDGVHAFLGIMRYRNQGAQLWNNPGGYDAANVNIALDGVGYDFEHILIKGVQHLWPYATITNTQKTGGLNNPGAYALNITVAWTIGGFAQNVNLAVPAGGNLA